MADTGQINRPLSPHLSIFRHWMNMMMSIVHRITGVGLGLTGILLVWWFLAAAVSAEYFAFVDDILTSWIGLLVLTVSLWAFWYHMLNGIRHLRWDMVKGMGIGEYARAGWITIIGSVVLTLITIFVAI
ncbi:MAG: succinate dehydrogenase, cytochrome b556 subunit [Rhodobacteraceae bacterium]|nr:succinate dehydrogenase, cytochrome b556 subunit [Paracoccaceae bacterium]